MTSTTALRAAVEQLVQAEIEMSWSGMQHPVDAEILESELTTARALYELELARVEARL